ncbi:hypothetical protein APUTEX25_001793 [Auxenochlorella protothecoides]|uniref:AAR2-like protein n=1 Tax=Auxenochlorella protothecoides TaxID=3075 RepID=A0A3M7L4D2_AUXPR|nr:hypothetical protein APUTEX25_001793 [Auxenochlorella protothecoides]|eukprot:RMZ57593.1 hypothetical protein APUTEX25_001793 [Auxenochlorella protothecoides]
MSAPYRINMDNVAARDLLKKGATILLLDVPPGTAVGIDHQVRALHESLLQVVIKRWDPQQEYLVAVDEESEVMQFTQAVHMFEFDRHLAPYDLANLATWRSLSAHLTPAVIDRLQPVGGNICVLAEAPPGSRGRRQTPAEAALEAQLSRRKATSSSQGGGGSDGSAVPGSHPQGALVAAPHAGRCFYTRTQTVSRDGVYDAAARTRHNLDRSEGLDSLIREEYAGDGDLLLGELQFAFLAFLVGQSFAGLMQWRALLQLLLGCFSAALGQHQQLFAQALDVLAAQLAASSQKQWTRGVQEESDGAGLTPALAESVARVNEALHELVGWEDSSQVQELGLGDDEDSPAVVDLDAPMF